MALSALCFSGVGALSLLLTASAVVSGNERLDESTQPFFNVDAIKLPHLASLPCREACPVLPRSELAAAPRIAIFGTVLETSANVRIYGNNGDYAHLTRKDTSRAFALGNHSEPHLREDLSNVTDQQVANAQTWLTGLAEQYKVLGVIEGHFYTADGSPTKAMKTYFDSLDRHAAERSDDEQWDRWYPQCNLRNPRIYWCGPQGDNPMWLHRTGKKRRCACVGSSAQHPMLPPLFRAFDDCSLVEDRYECRGKPPPHVEL